MCEIRGYCNAANHVSVLWTKHTEEQSFTLKNHPYIHYWTVCSPLSKAGWELSWILRHCTETRVQNNKSITMCSTASHVWHKASGIIPCEHTSSSFAVTRTVVYFKTWRSVFCVVSHVWLACETEEVTCTSVLHLFAIWFVSLLRNNKLMTTVCKQYRQQLIWNTP